MRCLRALTRVAERGRTGPRGPAEDLAENVTAILMLFELSPSQPTPPNRKASPDSDSDGGDDSDSDAPAQPTKKPKVDPGPRAEESKLSKAFEESWLKCLQLPMRRETYKRVLYWLPEHVMPHLSAPLKLADFLTDSFDLGGLSSILALSGLFILMRCHNLDYPRFYDKLYQTLTPKVFYAKHRARYFRLLTVCLTAPQVPSYVAAAFIKK